ncbi:uncharacterized protein PG986_001442 [Apiospora aurea]|uniref:C2H2-type domain-containing protein n=1 Tax=Apiospora aurea TaxID=335848 RepID=A0ABR1QWT6_9PEZI
MDRSDTEVLKEIEDYKSRSLFPGRAQAARARARQHQDQHGEAAPREDAAARAVPGAPRQHAPPAQQHARGTPQEDGAPRAVQLNDEDDLGLHNGMFHAGPSCTTPEPTGQKGDETPYSFVCECECECERAFVDAHAISQHREHRSWSGDNESSSSSQCKEK